MLRVQEPLGLHFGKCCTTKYDNNVLRRVTRVEVGAKRGEGQGQCWGFFWWATEAGISKNNDILRSL